MHMNSVMSLTQRRTLIMLPEEPGVKVDDIVGAVFSDHGGKDRRGQDSDTQNELTLHGGTPTT